MLLQCHLAYDVRGGGERLPLSGSTECAVLLRCSARLIGSNSLRTGMHGAAVVLVLMGFLPWAVHGVVVAPSVPICPGLSLQQGVGKAFPVSAGAQGFVACRAWGHQMESSGRVVGWCV